MYLVVKQRNGFTLVEILVTLGVLGLLLAILPITFAKQKAATELNHAEKTIKSWVELARTTARKRGGITELVIEDEVIAVRYQSPENISMWIRVKEGKKNFDSSKHIYCFNSKGICTNNEKPVSIIQNYEPQKELYILKLNGVQEGLHPH